MIRVIIPYHLRTLAKVNGDVLLDVAEPATIAAVLDALENQYPVLRGTIRELETGKRRALVRFFACQDDLSHQPLDTLLPAAVAAGREPFMVVGAMAGG